jgi:hypothetical protein
VASVAARISSLICIAMLAGGVAAGAVRAPDQRGGAGSDRLVGGKGPDVLRGLRGADELIGGRGADVLVGGKGPDVLRGGPGRDSFNMRAGVELAAPGRDRINARDGGQDEISCGAGRDLAIVDATEDGIYDCERVREP